MSSSDEKDYSYVVITDLSESATWITKEMAEKVEAALAESGWDVEIRAPRTNSEAEGTYYRKPDGTLQILGFSLPSPEALSRAIDQAVDALV